MHYTVINEQLNISRITHINSQLLDSNITIINPYIRDQKNLVSGVLLGDKYQLEEKLDIVSGEADLFMCKDSEDNHFVAKVYNRNTNINRDAINAISDIDSPHIGRCFDLGEIDGRLYEIIPYYANGSLQGRIFSYEELRSNIIPALNEALKTLHDNGIIHKDLKPSNIMSKDDGSVAVIDFGISSQIEEGLTMIVDKTGLTPEYSAPETFRGVFLRESDYYSLGITIFELFVGHQPYEGLAAEDLERLVSVQKIPLPEDMPIALQELVIGLTYTDISNRKDKTNSNRRWTYEEVKRWLEGKKQPLPGSGKSYLENNPYVFDGKPYTELESLIDAMALNWEKGKNELFKGHMTAYFEKVSDLIAEVCIEAEQKAASNSGQDDLIFFETIYKLVPQYKKLCWRGMQWENLPALGRDILDVDSSNQSAIQDIVDKMMIYGILNKYMQMFDTETFAKQTKLLNEVSILYMDAYANAREREKYIYELGYLLSGQIVLNVDGMSFYSLRELKDYMEKLYKESFINLRLFSSKLLINSRELTPQFEVWLLAMGKGPELREWRRKYGLIREEDITV